VGDGVVTRDEAEAWADDADVELLFADGFDDAIVGIGQRFNTHFVVYDFETVIATLMKDGMSEEDALEYYDFNVVGGWVGDATPCFVTRTVADA
jgi:hypothetical protein